MKNITMTLDAKTAAWVRLTAAKHGKSVSRFVGELLHQHMHDSRNYDEAMRRFLGKAPVVLDSDGTGYATREELHDRAGLR
jgi:hypothetical protein